MARVDPAAAEHPLPTAEFQVLLALVDGVRHGHAIKLDIATRTDGRVVMGPGTLYGALKRMLRRGLVEETEPRRPAADDDERRRYYRITRAGRAVARAEALRLQQLLQIAGDKKLIAAP